MKEAMTVESIFSKIADTEHGITDESPLLPKPQDEKPSLKLKMQPNSVIVSDKRGKTPPIKKRPDQKKVVVSAFESARRANSPNRLNRDLI